MDRSGIVMKDLKSRGRNTSRKIVKLRVQTYGLVMPEQK
jgi:hypothetical protein